VGNELAAGLIVHEVIEKHGIKIAQPRICCIEKGDQNNDSVKGFPKGISK
jgi:hypothetical protein